MTGKEYVLRPMSPSQVIANKQASTHHGDTSERVHHQKESESHKPKFSASSPREKNLVLLATKREMREVCENPSSVIHFVLLCKDEVAETNNPNPLPLVFSNLLQELKDIVPDELPPVSLLYVALNIGSTSSSEHLFRTRLPTASTPKKLRRSNGKYNNSSTTAMYVKA